MLLNKRNETTKLKKHQQKQNA